MSLSLGVFILSMMLTCAAMYLLLKVTAQPLPDPPTARVGALLLLVLGAMGEALRPFGDGTVPTTIVFGFGGQFCIAAAAVLMTYGFSGENVSVRKSKGSPKRASSNRIARKTRRVRTPL